jgi:type I restriction enzyme S subunit
MGRVVCPERGSTMTQMMEQMTIPGLEEMAQGSPGRGRWEMVKLSHLFEKPISGEWGDEATEEDSTAVGVIRTTNFSKDYRIKTSSEIVLRKIDLLKVEKKKLLFGDVIIEKSGGSPNQPVGRIVFYDLERGNTLCNNFTSILRPKQNTFPKYACYALFYLHQNGSTLKFQNKTTGIINLKLERYLEDIKIPLPPLPEQQRIVARLDKAQQLIDQRKEQLKLMDALVQSLFYEMFGDEISLRTNYEHVSMNSLGISATSGKSVSGEGRPALEHELGVLKVSAVTKGVFNQNENKAVSQMPEGQLIFPKAGDVLVTRANTRELVAACCVVNQDFHNIFLPDKIWRINLNESLSNWFFKFIINVSYIRNEIIGKASGTSGSMLNISQQNFLETKIPLPPLSLQQAFADRVKQIEAIKQSMTASLRELEHNFNALMQQAFGG